jgi:hypothetical protein
MVTATKTKPTKTREDELAEQLEEHRSEMAILEQKASELDQAAAELDARAAAKVTNLDGSLTELPKSIDDDRGLALLKRQRASDLRTRAQAYAAKVELPAIAAEHDQLRQERIVHEQLEAAGEEAQALTAEIEIRGAWLFRNLIAERAVERRFNEAVDQLTELQNKHHLVGIDVGRFTRLGAEALQLAERYVQAINRDLDPNFWRLNLPELEPLELPEELRAVTTVISGPYVDQVGGRTFDPTVPKDQAMRLAAGAKPIPRSPDGTPAGSVPVNVVPRPRTEAEDRARRKKIAAELEAADTSMAPAVKDGG